MRGRTCVVTGATGGIGKEIARGLARAGATVVVAARDPEKGASAVREIGAGAVFERVDLSSQRSIRDFAARVAREHPRLDALVNNAGVWLSERRETCDGIEATWATNVLGYFLLTNLLLPPLEASGAGRVVNVASTAAGGLDLDDVEFARRPYNGVAAYAQSKQANRMLTWALAARQRGRGVTANALHPGVVDSEISRGGGAFRAIASVYFRTIGVSPEKGADTAVWLASSDDVAGATSKFWVRRKERRCRFRDEAATARLWSLCEAMTSGVGSPR